MGWTIAPGVHGTSGGVISLGEIAQEPSGGASDGAGDGHGVAEMTLRPTTLKP